MNLNNDRYSELIHERLSEDFGEYTTNEIEKTINKFNNNKRRLRILLSKIKAFLTSEKILKQIYYMKEIRKMIDNSIKGCNLYVSKDGVNFYQINNNGFHDKFNYGVNSIKKKGSTFWIEIPKV